MSNTKYIVEIINIFFLQEWVIQYIHMVLSNDPVEVNLDQNYKLV